MNTRAPGPFLLLILAAFPIIHSGRAETIPAPGLADSRLRVATYCANEVYRLHGYVGYQIALQFEAGESFVGLGAGDIEGLSFVAQGEHLFLKPKAPKVATNLTVLTTRRHYHFEYTASAQRPDPTIDDVIYAVRFQYPEIQSASANDESIPIESLLDRASTVRPRNFDYWFCGHASLKPTAASDDGVHTRIQFGARADFPALFVRNEDGTESLLNFNIEGGEVIVHRVARQLIVRRGKLAGCIVNKGFTGGGERLDSGTVSPDVERERRIDSR